MHIFIQNNITKKTFDCQYKIVFRCFFSAQRERARAQNSALEYQKPPDFKSSGKL